jgi:hypothetical protein
LDASLFNGPERSIAPRSFFSFFRSYHGFLTPNQRPRSLIRTLLLTGPRDLKINRAATTATKRKKYLMETQQEAFGLWVIGFGIHLSVVNRGWERARARRMTG